MGGERRGGCFPLFRLFLRRAAAAPGSLLSLGEVGWIHALVLVASAGLLVTLMRLGPFITCYQFPYLFPPARVLAEVWYLVGIQAILTGSVALLLAPSLSLGVEEYQILRPLPLRLLRPGMAQVGSSLLLALGLSAFIALPSVFAATMFLPHFNGMPVVFFGLGMMAVCVIQGMVLFALALLLRELAGFLGENPGSVLTLTGLGLLLSAFFWLEDGAMGMARKGSVPAEWLAGLPFSWGTALFYRMLGQGEAVPRVWPLWPLGVLPLVAGGLLVLLTVLKLLRWSGNGGQTGGGLGKQGHGPEKSWRLWGLGGPERGLTGLLLKAMERNPAARLRVALFLMLPLGTLGTSLLFWIPDPFQSLWLVLPGSVLVFALLAGYTVARMPLGDEAFWMVGALCPQEPRLRARCLRLFWNRGLLLPLLPLMGALVLLCGGGLSALALLVAAYWPVWGLALVLSGRMDHPPLTLGEDSGHGLATRWPLMLTCMIGIHFVLWGWCRFWLATPLRQELMLGSLVLLVPAVFVAPRIRQLWPRGDRPRTVLGGVWE